MDLKEINKNDPLNRNVKKEIPTEEFSPMDPPDAYTPPGLETMPREKMHVYLQDLMKDHDVFKKELQKFEDALVFLQEKGIDKETDHTIRHFFHYFDHEIQTHGDREDKEFFPLLEKRLVADGEHSKGVAEQVSPIDVLEGDHVKMLQMAAITFNFFGLASRLPDEKSRLIVLDTAINQGKALVELLRLHIFREDNVLFPLAHKYISSEEFAGMKQ